MNKEAKSPRRWRILVTPKEACKSLDSLPSRVLKGIELIPTFGRIDDPQKLIELLKDKDAVALDIEPINANILRNCPRLRVISRFGEGCDAIDLMAAKKFRVRVTRTRGVASLAVARHAMALILALTNNLTINDRNLKKGLWKRLSNCSVEGTTVGILGFGNIGKRVADLAEDFGFKVLIYSRRRENRKYKFVRSLKELVDLADIISLHLSLTHETRNIISKHIIKRLKGKFLVNTARGGLVDEKILLESLEANEIAGYATDVFSAEPILGHSKRLAKHPKVISSPHVAAFDRITAIKMTQRAVENVLNCLNGENGKVDSYVV